MIDPTSKLNTVLTKNLQQMVKAQHNILETLPNLSGAAFQQITAQAWGEMAGEIMKNPMPYLQLQQNWWELQFKLWMSFMEGMTGKIEPVVRPHPKDRRFADEEWYKSAVHNYLMQTYLVNTQALQRLVDAYGGNGKTGRTLSYQVRQLIEALSPSNYFLTNPDAIAKAIESRGISLVNGFTNLVNDLNQGRVTMTDTKPFEVGKNIAVTKGAVVYEDPLVQLLQYSPTTAQVHERPVVILPPWINKFYILDLQASTSYAKYSVDQGFTTFMVSWRNPSDEMGNTSWEDYMTSALRCFEAVQAITGAKTVNAVGYCIGGTLLASVLAHLQAKKKDFIGAVTLLAAMVDFTDPGELSIFIDEKQIGEREREFLDGGVYPGNVMANAFAFLRANDLVWSYVVKNYLKGEDYTPFDLLYWNSDPTNLPGNMYLYYIRNMYLNNALAKPCALELLGTKIDVSQVKKPLLIVACEEDHIAPWRTVYNGTEVFGGPDRQFILSESGHIAGIVNPPGKKKRKHYYNGPLGQGPDAWHAGAQVDDDSWWPRWAEWLKGHSGKQVAAPTALGSKDYPVIEPAPGRYVTEDVDVTGWAM
ncbi:MAG: class I poly(R)-hydroxyalkanoic acid synthase [Bacteroidia bacterium]|nr:class I poly(R)-hydroxyalkanoic acid synthase [Bacteroidia bacterium]